MSGQTLNHLIATVFLRASDPPPPPPPPPQQFHPRAPETSTSVSSPASSPASSSADPADPAEQTLALLTRAQHVSHSIGVVSPNDALRDISTSSLRTLFLPSLQSELHSAVRTGTDHAARKQRLRASQDAASNFLNRVLALGVVPPSTSQLVGWTCASVATSELDSIGLDANILKTERSGAGMPHSREVKIAVFKLERALKSNLEQFRSAYQAKKKLVQIKTPNDVFYDLLLYPGQGGRGGGDDASDDEQEDQDDDATGETETASTSAPGGIASVRQYLLALLNLHVLRNAQQIASASQELELLRSMPPPPPPSASTTSGSDPSSSEWRLDRRPSTLPQTGPLMAPGGKVLRPFTITNQSRAEVASQVFRPGYRLPTMSIDEYLDEEQRRGNIIQGGGQPSYDKPTSTEQRQQRAEQDGTTDAELAEEEQRQNHIHWDTFSEQHRKGAGNTMNRG